MYWTWTDDDVLAPDNVTLARKHMVSGERYKLREGRSTETESHYFACVQWAWDNLPEDKAGTLPHPDDLRKRALIACGFANSRQLVCGTNERAIRTSAFVGAGKEYRVVSVHEDIVTELTAQSQDRESMGDAETFAKSKDAVIEYCAAMIGVTVEELMKASRADFDDRKATKRNKAV